MLCVRYCNASITFLKTIYNDKSYNLRSIYDTSSIIPIKCILTTCIDNH